MKVDKELQFTKPQMEIILQEAIKRKQLGFKEIMEITLKALMKAERQIFMEEISKGNKGNGYRKILNSFNGSMLELQIPRDRKGLFKPLMLELVRTSQAEVSELAFKLYSSGLSTKDIGEVFDTIYGKKYSSSGISKLCETSRKDVLKWLKRPIDSYYPVIYIDAHFNRVRRDTVAKEAFYVVLGLRRDFSREVIAVENYPTEGASIWAEIFQDLKDRGLKKIDLVVSDGLKGIEDAVAENLQGTDLQLCTTHLKRELLKKVRPESKKELADDLRYLFETNSTEYKPIDVKSRIKYVDNKWGDKYPDISKSLNNYRIHLYFTYLDYEPRIQSMIYTTNWIERLNKEFKRVIDIRNSMPNPDSALALVGAVAIKMTGNKYTYPIYTFGFEKKFKKCCDD
jgi:transposase-like protein